MTFNVSISASSFVETSRIPSPLDMFSMKKAEKLNGWMFPKAQTHDSSSFPESAPSVEPIEEQFY